MPHRCNACLVEVSVSVGHDEAEVGRVDSKHFDDTAGIEAALAAGMYFLSVRFAIVLQFHYTGGKIVQAV